MTSYFVDYASGSDASAGTSTGAAWKHCPGDANATGNAAACVLAPGDVVNFKGGVVYEGTVVISASGSEGSPITYKTGSEWGTGLAVFDGGRATLLENARRWAFTATDKSYIVVDGFEVQNLRTVFHDVSGAYSDAILFDGGHDIEICNCNMHDIFPTPTPVVQGGSRGVGVSGSVATATTLSDPTVDFSAYASAGGSIGYHKVVVGWNTNDYDSAYGYIGALVGGDIHTVTVYSDINRTTAGWASGSSIVLGHDGAYFCWVFDMRESHRAAYGSNAIRIEDAYNIDVHSNTISECRQCVAIGWHTASDGFRVYNNTLSMCVWGARLSGPRGQAGTGIEIHGNTIHDFTPYNTHGYGWHTDGIFIYGTGTSVWPAIAANGIDLYGNTFYGDFSIANTGMIYLENGCANARVWNNVFRGITSGGYCILGASGANLWILNNTFNDTAGTKCIRMLNVTGVRLINCVWFGFNRWLGFFSLEDTASELEQSSNNLFFLNGSSTDKRMEAEAVHYSVAEWLATEWGTGCLTDNPLFVSTSDVHLQATSPARGAGIDLSAMIPATDADGVARSDWSIGAYEHVSETPGEVGGYLVLSASGGHLALEVAE